MDDEQRVVAVHAAMDQLKKTYVVADRLCTKCVFGPIKGGEGRCEHFAHWQISHDPVVGEKRLRIPVTAREARSEDGLCGPNGMLFEPYKGFRRVALWLARKDMERAGHIIYWSMLAAVAIIASLMGR
jgi:hypothetical protein